ncbi:MAG: winged-helix domain-containing protein [Streptosporangiaceae bacterium]|nr:transcriptional regulator [Actinomycetota bacterium]
MSNVLLLTGAAEQPADILPSLSLLPHTVRVAEASLAAAVAGPVPDAILVDARRELVQAKRLLQGLRGQDRDVPVIVIVTEGGWAAITADWGADDLVLQTAGPGEVEARLRLALGRAAGVAPAGSGELRSGDLVINEITYSARMHGRAMDLTFKEFELLKFLVQHPGRVFTRAQLLQEVWGYDYFGGTRTVDVHVRRLRAKLGAENESLIGTVRNVGYRFVPAKGSGGREGRDGGGLSDSQADGTPDDGTEDGTPDDAAAAPATGGERGKVPGTSRKGAQPAHADR